MFFLKKCYNSFFKIMNESQLRDKLNTIHTYLYIEKKPELFLTFKKMLSDETVCICIS